MPRLLWLLWFHVNVVWPFAEPGAVGDAVSSRLVVTFRALSDNNITGADLGDAKVVKQYGRRLVLDLRTPFDLGEQERFFRQSLNAVQRVEVDLLVEANQAPPSLQVSDALLVTDETGGANGTDPDLDGASISPAGQTPLWNLRDSEPYSIKVEGVWRLTNSTPDVVVAVVDTGIAEPAKGAFLHLLDGYDFISDDGLSVDWDGRDPDATDPGDWGDMCPIPSWHGTKVASILAARHDNEFGMKGIAQNCSVLPVRVLGLCRMGYATDVADAIVWAAGGAINGVPGNPRPAKIISLSLAGQGACPDYLQSAVSQAQELGAVVVAAAGNNNQNVSRYFPANCKGVIAVAASTRDGRLAGYSNWGNLIALSAPGGDSANAIMMLSIDPTETNLEVKYGTGTSFSVPHVAGVAAISNSLLLNIENVSLRTRHNLLFLSHTNTFNCALSMCGSGIVSADYIKGFDVKSNQIYQRPTVNFNQTFTESLARFNSSNISEYILGSQIDILLPPGNGPGSILNTDSESFFLSDGPVLDGEFFRQCGAGTFMCRMSIMRDWIALRGFSYACCNMRLETTYSTGYDQPQGCIGHCQSYDTHDPYLGWFSSVSWVWNGYILTRAGGETRWGSPSSSQHDRAKCGRNGVVNGLYGRWGATLDEVYVLCRHLFVPSPVNFYSNGANTNEGGGAIACPANTFSPPGSFACQPAITCPSGHRLNPVYNTVSSSYVANCPVGSYVCGFNYQNLFAYFFYCCSIGGGLVGHYRISNNNFNGGVGAGVIYTSTNSGYPPPPFYASNTENTYRFGISRVIWNWNGLTIYTNGDLYTILGGTGGTVYDVSCSAGQVATGFYGWWGANIDQASVICNRLFIPCSTCPVGNYISTACTTSSDVVCTACPSCSTGKYNPTCGGTSSGTCINCPTCSAGSYRISCSGTSAGSCLSCGTCSEGKYRTGCSGTSSGTCVDCDAGTFKPNKGTQTSCSECFAGKYSTTTGAILSSVCTNCVAGTFSTALGAQDSSSCTGCSAGSFSTVIGAISSIVCSSCAAGTFSTVTGGTSSSVCSNCLAGTFSTQTSSACTGCSAGSFSTVLGATSSVVCSSCAAGTFSVLAGSTVCTDCAAGKFSVTTSATSSAVCSNCLAGTFSTSTGSSSSAVCTLCNAGTFSTSLGAPTSAACTSCSPGSFSSTAGASVCTACTGGTNFAASSGATACTACTSVSTCPSGRYIQTCTAAADTACMACDDATKPPNSYWLANQINTCVWACDRSPSLYFKSGSVCVLCLVPSSCAIGQFATTCTDTANGVCSGCTNRPANSFYTTFSPTYDTSGCSWNCNAGYSTGASTCNACPAGSFAPSSSTVCTLCAPGTFSSTVVAVSSASCVNCVAGTFSSASGSPSSAACTRCVAGAFSTAERAVSSATCTNCAAGTFSTAVGAASSATCSNCAVGTFSTLPGSVGCTPCPMCTDNGFFRAGCGLASSGVCATCNNTV